MKKIVIIGFGWASIGFLQEIDASKYEVVVISDKDTFVYTPLLAQNVKEDKGITTALSDFNKAIAFVKDNVTDVDFDRKVVQQTTKYDYVVFAHGSAVNTFGIQGVKENTHYLKSLEDSLEIRAHLETLAKGSTVAVIGCGLAGSELLGTLIDYNKFKVVAIDALERPLITFKPDISNKATQLWKTADVDMYFNSMVTQIHPTVVDIKDKLSVNFDSAIWCGGIKSTELSQSINKLLGLDCLKGIPVDGQLRIQDKPKYDAFAMGDCAFSGNPPTAQVAYQQGRYLAKSFNRQFVDKTDFTFQNKGQIGYIGNGKSVYQNDYISGGGKLVYYMNNAIHLYHLGKIYAKTKLW